MKHRLTAHLTDAEIDALKNNPNVAKVEDDGPVYALQQSLLVEGQPVVQSETVPQAWRRSSRRRLEIGRGKGIKVAVLDTGIDLTTPTSP